MSTGHSLYYEGNRSYDFPNIMQRNLSTKTKEKKLKKLRVLRILQQIKSAPNKVCTMTRRVVMISPKVSFVMLPLKGDEKHFFKICLENLTTNKMRTGLNQCYN